VLVLSRFAGAAERLNAAVLTNPYHPAGVARDLDRALRMSREERVNRHRSLAPVVRATTARAWGDAFVRELERA
jgi:trehalose 6-phosphate synthase